MHDLFLFAEPVDFLGVLLLVCGWREHQLKHLAHVVNIQLPYVDEKRMHNIFRKFRAPIQIMHAILSALIVYSIVKQS